MKNTPWQRFKKIVAAAEPSYALFALAMLFLVITETFPFLYPLLLKNILDALNQGINLKSYAVIYAIILIVHTLLLYGKTFFGVLISANATYTLRKKLIYHINSISLLDVRKYSTGNWISRLSADMDVLGVMFRDGILELVSNALLLAFSIAFMFWQEPRLAIFTMIFFPAMMLITVYFRRRLKHQQIKYRQRLSSLTGFIQELLPAIPLMQVFGKQAFLTEKFASEQKSYQKAGINWSKSFAAFFPLIQSFSDLSLIACYAGGLWWISQGSISVGSLVAFVWVASIYTRPLRDLSNRINQVQTSLVAGDRVLDALETGKVEYRGRNKLDPQPHSPAVRFRGVSFAYHAQQPVLDSVSFSVPANSFCALAGRSGQGKSTILHLLSRLYAPQTGEIEIFGQNIAEIEAAELKSCSAYISQDPFLFAGSVKENILLGAEFCPELFEQALERARISEMLDKLPQGIDTQIGAQGIEVSRGQRQLIACARAFYRNPQILLLDEPVASVDSQTEHLLQAAVADLLENRTALVVSHRVSTLTKADIVVFLDSQKRVFTASHAELAQNNAEYAQMFAKS